MGIEEISIEADGFITREQDIKPLEKVTDNTANPTTECCYPECEKCRNYASVKGASYCTVPMVVSKQMYLMAIDTIDRLSEDIAEVREMVYEHILGGYKLKDEPIQNPSVKITKVEP